MKKVAVALFLVIAALGVAACGGGGSSSSSGSETTPSEAESGETEVGGAETGGKVEAGGAQAEGGTAEGSAAVDIEADPSGQLDYEEKSATAEAGNVTVDFNNSSSVPHNVAIEDSSGKTLGETEVLAEGSDSTELDLKPGTYTFFCTVPGHREAGMEGTLTVK